MVASAQLPSLPVVAPASRTAASRKLQRPASSRASRPRRDMRIQALAPLTAVAATTATAAAALTVAMRSSKELRPTAKVCGCERCTACMSLSLPAALPQPASCSATGGRLPPSPPASRHRSALACLPPSAAAAAGPEHTMEQHHPVAVPLPDGTLQAAFAAEQRSCGDHLCRLVPVGG